MLSYKIYSIKAKDILSRYQVEKHSGNFSLEFKINIRDLLQYNTSLTLLDEPDSPLFRQIRMVYGLYPDEFDAIDITKNIMILDFDDIFKIGADENVAIENKTNLRKSDLVFAGYQTKSRYLFENGFDVVFDDDLTMHFRPFDKSSSMSRKSRITFIADDTFFRLEHRLCLDIDFKNIALCLSKYYAYRGLYLSSGTAIPFDEGMDLNEETVIIIKDEYVSLPETSFVTAKAADSSTDSGTVFYKKAQKKKRIRVNAYDGEGIILPEYGKLIAEKYAAKKPHLHLNPADLQSFQIRLPFTKGMIHTVDLKGFFENTLFPETDMPDYDTLFIKDVFGITRKLSKVRIILTESMFKCAKWLKTLQLSDPMQYYFEKFHEYEHALYIVNTNMGLSNNGKTTTKYQLLNTLDLNLKAFLKMVDDHFKHIDSLSVKDLIENSKNASGEDSFDNRDLLLKVPGFVNAAGKNSDFEKDPKTVEYLKSIKLSAARDTVFGRLQISGEDRFLSGDLIGLMIHVAACSDQAKNNPVKQCIKDFQKEKLLYDNAFFSPQPTLHYRRGRWYGQFRNPHLSRNEQCLLRFYSDDLYEKYLGHLRNIIFVSRNSLAPATMGGADFDGDYISTITDPLINQAIARSVYDKDTGKRNAKMRQLPFIMIPSHDPVCIHPKDTVDFKVIRDTFNNQIGRISNIAIRIGKFEYDPTKDSEEKAELLNDCDCSFCTILGGLELDAPKAGRHPDLTPIFGVEKNINEKTGQKQDAYLLFKSRFKELKSNDHIKHGTFKIEGSKKDKAEADILMVSGGNNNILIETPFIHDDDHAANIDRLPGLYLIHHQKSKDKRTAPKIPGLECFMQYPLYAIEDFDDERGEELKNLILTYKHLLQINRELIKITNEANKANLQNKVDYILILQYGSLDTKLNSGCSVKQIIDYFYQFLKDRLTDINGCRKLIDELNEKLWAFRPHKDREALLTDILSHSRIMIQRDYPSIMLADLTTVLTNFKDKGYKIIYFVIKDILATLLADPKSHLDKYADDPKLISEELKQIFFSSVRNGYGPEQCKHYLAVKANEEVRKIFDNDMDQAIIYSHYRRLAGEAPDRSGGFFWDVFDGELVLNSLVEKKGKKNA